MYGVLLESTKGCSQQTYAVLVLQLRCLVVLGSFTEPQNTEYCAAFVLLDWSIKPVKAGLTNQRSGICQFCLSRQNSLDWCVGVMLHGAGSLGSVADSLVACIVRSTLAWAMAKGQPLQPGADVL